MVLVKWRDSYSTGVDFFDNEHKKIIGLINDMFEICRDHLSVDETRKVVSELLDYTLYHFEHEERAMEAVNYVYIEKQRQEHDDLKRRVLDFKDRLGQEGDKTISELYLFLRDWLTGHILHSDAQYRTAFKGKNIEKLLRDLDAL